MVKKSRKNLTVELCYQRIRPNKSFVIKCPNFLPSRLNVINNSESTIEYFRNTNLLLSND